MKISLFACVLLASAGCLAAPKSVPRQDEHKMQGQPAPVSTRPANVSSPSPSPVRHLSEAERAELRRQLQQFNRQYPSKRP